MYHSNINNDYNIKMKIIELELMQTDEEVQRRLERRSERPGTPLLNFYRKWGYNWIQRYYAGRLSVPVQQQEKCRYWEICSDYSARRLICNQYDGDKSKCVKPNFLEVI